MAQITYQSLFKLYPKLSGMTGTAKTEVRIIMKFDSVYNIFIKCSANLMIVPWLQNFAHIITGEGVLENVSDASY